MSQSNDSKSELGDFGVSVPEYHLPDHMTRDYREVSADRMDRPLKNREGWCLDCENRVTQNTDKTGEYGHKEDCAHHYQGEVTA